MAQVTFGGARHEIMMTDRGFVQFGPVEAKQPFAWSWITPNGADIDLVGSGLVYDAAGKAVAGKISEVQIDIGNNNFLHPDILIKGLAVDAWWLDNSPASFWSAVLGGNDQIDARSLAQVATSDRFPSVLFGDDLESAMGLDWAVVTDRGGNDTFLLGDAPYVVVGDVDSVLSDPSGTLFSNYQGGTTGSSPIRPIMSSSSPATRDWSATIRCCAAATTSCSSPTPASWPAMPSSSASVRTHRRA